jgi:DNA polymerase-3 subunit gamma/tau
VESGQQDDDDEEHMLAEAGRADPQAPRRDPEEVALELLQNELGARRIDNG